MEEFFLSRILAGNKLNIVHQQNVRPPVSLMKFARRPAPDRFDQLVGKLVALNIDNVHVWVIMSDLIADGVKQMGFSQTGVSVNEQGIVERGRFACHGHRGRMSKFIGRTHNKGFERKFIVFTVLAGLFFGFRCLFLFRNHQSDLDILAENLPKSLFQKVHIIM